MRKQNSTSHHPGLPVRLSSVAAFAAAIDRDVKALPVPNTATLRAIRAKYSRALKPASPDFVLRLARRLLETDAYRWIAYELIRDHRPAFKSLRQTDLEELGRGINSWWTVDAFARTLSGPAWLQGQVSDRLMLKWARSPDPWWRRAALVSTVALNVRSQGGRGDVPRTLRVCRALAKDREDMVIKALSWALRELVVHDPQGVRKFLDEHDQVLAARVKREVKNKLRTGLKNP
jgi:3-methyladenine DNA glycosylase AlkD